VGASSDSTVIKPEADEGMETCRRRKLVARDREVTGEGSDMLSRVCNLQRTVQRKPERKKLYRKSRNVFSCRR
jgi:hypothetical protein